MQHPTTKAMDQIYKIEDTAVKNKSNQKLISKLGNTRR